MRKHLWQRLTALFLMAALVMTMVPLSAFAGYEAENLEYVNNKWMLGLKMTTSLYEKASEDGVEYFALLYPDTYWENSTASPLSTVKSKHIAKATASSLNGKHFDYENKDYEYRNAFPEVFTEGFNKTLDTHWVYRDGLRMPKDTVFGLSAAVDNKSVIFWYGGDDVKDVGGIRAFWPDRIIQINWNNGNLTYQAGTERKVLRPLGNSTDQKRPAEGNPAPVSRDMLKLGLLGVGMAGVLGATAIAADSYVVKPSKVTADTPELAADFQVSTTAKQKLKENTKRVNVEYLRVDLGANNNGVVREVVLPIKTLGRENYKVMRMQGGEAVELQKLQSRPEGGARQANTWAQEGKKLYLYLDEGAELSIGYDGILAYIF